MPELSSKREHKICIYKQNSRQLAVILWHIEKAALAFDTTTASVRLAFIKLSVKRWATFQLELFFLLTLKCYTLKMNTFPTLMIIFYWAARAAVSGHVLAAAQWRLLLCLRIHPGHRGASSLWHTMLHSLPRGQPAFTQVCATLDFTLLLMYREFFFKTPYACTFIISIIVVQLVQLGRKWGGNVMLSDI